MKLSYYPDTDTLYIDLSEKISVERKEISEGVELDRYVPIKPCLSGGDASEQMKYQC